MHFGNLGHDFLTLRFGIWRKNEFLTAKPFQSAVETRICHHFLGVLHNILSRHCWKLFGSRRTFAQRTNEHEDDQLVHSESVRRGPLLHCILCTFASDHLYHGRMGVRSVCVQGSPLHHLPHHVRQHLYAHCRVLRQVRPGLDCDGELVSFTVNDSAALGNFILKFI